MACPHFRIEGDNYRKKCMDCGREWWYEDEEN